MGMADVYGNRMQDMSHPWPKLSGPLVRINGKEVTLDALVDERNEVVEYFRKKCSSLDRELDEARERIAELEDRPEANIRWSCSQMDFAMHLFGMDAQSGVGANCNYKRAGRAMDYLAKHALVPSTRVPFSDAQIERMAKAAKRAHKECFYSDSNLVDIYIDEKWRRCVRAALTAGGLDCDVEVWIHE